MAYVSPPISLVGELIRDILPIFSSVSDSSDLTPLHLPSRLLEHASGPVGDFLVHPALLSGVDFAAAVFLLDGVKA